MISFLKDHQNARRLMLWLDKRWVQSPTRSPVRWPFLQPNPALEISTGATANAQGQFAYALSGIDANEVYATAAKLTAKMYQYPDSCSLF